MIRKSLHLKADGFKEGPIDGGAFSFWEYTLNLASKGHWGFSLPEYLIWTYQDSSQSYDITNFASGRLEKTYPSLWKTGGFPVVPAWDLVKNTEFDYMPLEKLPLPSTIKTKEVYRRYQNAPTVLFMLENLVFDDDGTISLDLLILQELVVTLRWDVIVVISGLISRDLRGTGYWMENSHIDLCQDQGLLQPFTPEIFCLNTFLHPEDYPLFLSQVIRSRDIDIVMISGKSAYQMLPWLKRCHPEPLFVDVVHDKDSGAGREAATHSSHLHGFVDLTLVQSENLKKWLVGLGVAKSKILLLKNMASSLVFCESVLEDEINKETKELLLQKYNIQPNDKLILLLEDQYNDEFIVTFVVSLMAKLTPALKDTNTPGWKLLLAGDSTSLRIYFQATQGIDTSHYVLAGDFSDMALTELIQRSSAVVIPPPSEGGPTRRTFAGIALPIVLSIAITVMTPVVYHASSSVPGIDMIPNESLFRISEQDQEAGGNAEAMAKYFSSKLEWIFNNFKESKNQVVATKRQICQSQRQGNYLKDSICLAKSRKVQGAASINPDGIVYDQILNWQVFPIIENLRNLHETEAKYT